MLDGSHHVNGSFTSLCDQKVHLVQAHAVLARAGAAQAQGALNQALVQAFCDGPFLGVVGVDEVAKVEVAIAHMADAASVLLVTPSLPVNSVKELAALAKAKAEGWW